MYNTAINVMPRPLTPQVGWGNTEDLTKSHVKFPSAWAKKLVKTPLCAHLDRGVSIVGSDLSIKINFGSANFHRQKPQGGARCRCQISSRCMGIPEGGRWGLTLTGA